MGGAGEKVLKVEREERGGEVESRERSSNDIFFEVLTRPITGIVRSAIRSRRPLASDGIRLVSAIRGQQSGRVANCLQGKASELIRCKSKQGN